MKFMLPIVIVLCIVGFTWPWRKYGKTERVRNVVDPLKLKMPVFGGLFQKLALARFARNLGTLLLLRRADPAVARHRRRRPPARS